MKKRTIIKLKSLFGGKAKLKRPHQQAGYGSRTPTPPLPPADTYRPLTPSPPPRPRQPPSPPVPTAPKAPVAPEAPGPLSLMPCPVCGRTFLPESLVKHVKICEKMATKKRKTFDSSRQRREGTDLEQFLPKNFGLPENSPFVEKSPPTTAKAPAKKTHSVRSAIAKPSADLSKCPHCGRAFGARAFERHVEWCADKAKILPAAPPGKAQPVTEAKHRLNARTQYKAPLRSRRSLTREKNSNSRSTSLESTSRCVSPPPPPAHPPKEYADHRYRHRASEGGSSAEYYDDNHVPVIRQSKRGGAECAGDAVRARQARLAKDLNANNSDKIEDDTVLDRDIDKRVNNIENHAVSKHKLDPKIKKALEKINKIYKKHNDKIKNGNNTAIKYVSDKGDDFAECVRENFELNVETNIQVPKIKSTKPSLIPTRKSSKTAIRKTKTASTEVLDDVEIFSLSSSSIPMHKAGSICERVKPYISKQNNADINLTSISKNTTITAIELCEEPKPALSKNFKSSKSKFQNIHAKSKVQTLREQQLQREKSTISTDSLDILKRNDFNVQSIGINTENLCCPCVPCVIHTSTNLKNNVSKKGDKDVNELKTDKVKKQVNYSEVIHTLLPKHESVEILYENPSTKMSSTNNNFDSTTTVNKLNPENNDELDNFVYEAGLSVSDVMVKCDIPTDPEVDTNDPSTDVTSGQTYTKFADTFNTDAEFDEFMNFTDKLIIGSENKDNSANEDYNVDLHSPNNAFIENLKADISYENQTSTTKLPTVTDDRFTDSINELKTQLEDLFSTADAPNINDENKKIMSLEHVTIYELQNVQIEDNPFSIKPKESQVPKSLPSITENNSVCAQPNALNFNIKAKDRSIKKIKHYKMLRDHKKSSKVFQTYIVANESNENSNDTMSVSSEAPPIKLPRIDNSRINDDYDPFVSAARQMKELMSSDTNIPKKIQSTSKDNIKTLPYLRNNKEKSPPFHTRPDNSKNINSIHKNPPQLLRMKSFGSNNDNNSVNTFGGRASSFRVNRNNNNKSSPKLNTTFTKSSKENINILDKSPFNRTSSLNKSFSSYTSSYSTNKKKEQSTIMSTSLNHSIQRTVKPPPKLKKIETDPVKREFVNLDCILTEDHSSAPDIQSIDPSLINENDNLPINVNTILNNPDMISSMESLLNSDNLPSKFDTFQIHQPNNNKQVPEINMHVDVENTIGNNIKSTNSTITTPSVDDLSLQYDKIMTSLEQSINSKISVRDDDSLCEDFDLEEFMTSFDEELNKQKSDTGKRSYSSTTRIVKSYDKSNCNITSAFNSISSSPKINTNGNGLIPFNKSNSMTFSNSMLTESVFPSSVKRSTSLLDTLPKKGMTPKMEINQKKNFKSYKTEEPCLEQEIMQSFKDFDKFYENEHVEDWMSNKKDNRSHSKRRLSEKSDTSKKESQAKENKIMYEDATTMPNLTPIQGRELNGKISNDSAYSSLNRISPSKLSLCNSKEMPTKMERGTTPPPHCSDSSGSHKEELRAMSSDEFLALERSTEALDRPLDRPRSIDKEIESYKLDMEKRMSGGRRTPSWRSRANLSSSSSECSLPAPGPPHRAEPPPPPPRLSRFCHECGSKFHIMTAKFCTECGAKRLNV